MKRPTPPCINCEERREGCHSKCEGYAEYQELNQKYKDELSEVKRRIFDMEAYRSSKRKRGKK